MTITTKYNLGQRVWLPLGSGEKEPGRRWGPRSFVITEISITHTQSGDGLFVRYAADYGYGVENGCDSTLYATEQQAQAKCDEYNKDEAQKAKVGWLFGGRCQS